MPQYASELFGPGAGAAVYPEGQTPVVTLAIPANRAAVADDPGTPDVNETVTAIDNNGSAEVTFTIYGGTFDSNIAGLMWDTDASDGNTDPAVSAPGSVASIVSGGRKGDNSITIMVEEAGATGGRETNTPETISFTMPRIADAALAGANPNAPLPFKAVWLNASSRLIAGSFADRPLSGGPPNYVVPVMLARDSLTLGMSDSNEKTIAISDDAGDGLTAFMSVKEKNRAGYVTLATVTIATKQVRTPAVAATDRTVVGFLQTGGSDTADDNEIYNPASDGAPATFHDLHDLDGELIDEGLRGTFSVSASGTRDLFNEGDMLFVDYDRNGVMGAGEGIAIDGDMAAGGALSIDPDAFDAGTTGNFNVYYMPGGKGAINHGAMINLTATVDYSDPSAIDEAPADTSTTFNFDGVGNPVLAYAIPHSANGAGDKANVRVRCESSAGCRVFAECWDDMGNRGFGEAPALAGNNVVVANSAAIEAITGMAPESRISCRVLSAGAVSVQQLTRDGNSGTLVNNTYVGQ